MTTINNHLDLLKTNVNEHTEKKGQLTYLSWAWAWAEALRADANASFQVQMFNGSPVCMIGQTCMVWVTVTMFGKSLQCQLPVMDNRNKAIANPDAFAVNTAIMRCLAKAIALHGLGLYIYAGEDLPESDEPSITQSQEADIIALAKEVGADLQAMAKYYQCKKFTELPATMYDTLIDVLEKKRKK